MRKTEIVTNHCKLKNKDVNLMKEGISEIGRDEVMAWRVKKCLFKDRTCEAAGCMYAPRGIGDAGNIDPFA